MAISKRGHLIVTFAFREGRVIKMRMYMNMEEEEEGHVSANVRIIFLVKHVQLWS